MQRQSYGAENWNRPKDEVDALMKYRVDYLKTETGEFNKSNVKLEVIARYAACRRMFRSICGNTSTRWRRTTALR